MKPLALFVITLICGTAGAQRVGPAVTYLSQGASNYAALGFQTSDNGRHSDRVEWATEWAATSNKDGLHGLFAAIGPRYSLGGFSLSVSGAMLMPLFAKKEAQQTLRLYLAPVLAVRNGPAALSVSFMPQVFPREGHAYALRASVAYFIK